MNNHLAPLLQQTHALDLAESVATSAAVCFASAGYLGPVACAGGYVRDLATARAPKDLDLFVDGGLIGNRVHAQRLGESLAHQLQHDAKVRTLSCYGAWAKDVDHVVKLEFPKDTDLWQDFLWINKAPIPWGGCDIVILNRDEMSRAGFGRGSFLQACCSRVDTRLNCIGATDSGERIVHPAWAEDVAHQRIVVQHARVGEDMARIHKRLTRLTESKFAGWTLHTEHEGGGLQLIAPLPDVS